jgi:hypothetical protein
VPSYVSPKKNTQYILFISLVSQASTKLMKANPTIAAGDFKVSTDGGALANLGTLPVVTPASSAMVKITLSTSEMNGDNVTVVCSDAAGAEWCDLTINIQTSARQLDDLAYPATTGRSLAVDASGGVTVGAYASGQAPLQPTTAGRTLDVNATGGAGLDWANIDNPSALANLSTTTVGLATIGSVASGGITASSFAAGAIDSAAIATDAIGSAELAASAVTEIQSGLATAAALATVQADTDDIQARLPAALVGGRIDASVGANNDKTGYALSGAGVQAIWDALTSALTAVGSIGKRIADNLDATISSRSTYAGADTGGTTTLLARLTSGRATNLDNLDAAVSTRLSTAGYTTPPTAAAIRAEMDTNSADLNTIIAYVDELESRLSSGRALLLDNLDVLLSSRLATSGYTAPDNATISAIAGYVDTEIAAIKAKTDNLPVSPAAVGSAMALTSGERNSVADALLDRADAVETGLTPRGALRLALAALAGKLSGAATTTVTIRNAVADSKARITATVDADGNRSSVTTDVT